MATNKWGIIFLLAMLATLSTSVSHKPILVGDDKGWGLNFDYQAWAKSKTFCVGDKLIFKYPVGKHNVIQVDETCFQKCHVPPNCEPLATGQDSITLEKPGKTAFICGIGDGKHCMGGMKFCIDVSPPPKAKGSPSPSHSGSGKEFVVGDDKGWTKNINYIAWATAGKEFFVGDKLIFKYPVGKHNVIPVDEAGYLGCLIPSTEPLATGQDSVTLDSPGRKFFICGVENHCLLCGMKLYVDVKPSKGVSHGSSGKEILVGDDKGWTKNFDYQAWANGKEFCVGDQLVFKYPADKHNVLKVDEASFQKCIVPPGSEAGAVNSGCDKIPLEKPGKECFICAIGNGKHCECGMKLCVNVLPKQSTPTPKGMRKLASTKNLGYNN